MSSVFKFLGGRSTAFALLFAVCGTVLAFVGKLSGYYISLIGAVQTLLTIRAVAQDFWSSGNGGAK